MAADAHLAAVVGQRITDLADHCLGRADRQELHEVDLVGVDVEGDVGEQLVIEPFAAVAGRQVLRLRKQPLVERLGRIG